MRVYQTTGHSLVHQVIVDVKRKSPVDFIEFLQKSVDRLDDFESKNFRLYKVILGVVVTRSDVSIDFVNVDSRLRGFRTDFVIDKASVVSNFLRFVGSRPKTEFLQSVKLCKRTLPI